MAAPSFPFADVARVSGQAPYRWGVGRTLFDSLSSAVPSYWAGDGEIAGTTKIFASPCSRRVRLVHRESGRVAREVVSDAGGVYVFARVKRGVAFTVYSLDDQPGGYNAAIADYVMAV